MRSSNPGFSLPPSVNAIESGPRQASASIETPLTGLRSVPISARISRDPRTMSTDSAQRLLDRLESEGITDVQSLLSRLGGSAGAGPSSASQNPGSSADPSSAP